MIRKFKKEDAAIYKKMVNEFYSSDAVCHPVDPQNIDNTIEELLKSDTYAECFMICNDDDTPVGYALLAKTFSQEAGGYVVWIEEIFITEENRASGYGKEFFNFLEEYYSKTARFRIEVTDSNVIASKFYRKLGYEDLDYSQLVLDK